MKALLARVSKVWNHLVWKVLGAFDRAGEPRVLHRREVPTKGRPRDETVWRIDSPAVIEPQWGYVIMEPNSLRMHGFDVMRGLLPPWAYAIPSAAQWLSPGNKQARHVVEMDRVISLRHFYEWNYYHFFVDVVGKLALLERQGLLDDVPVIVGPSAAELPFVRDLLSMPGFEQVKWYVQARDTYVRAQELTFCRSRVPHGERAHWLVDRLGLAPIDDPDDGRRILLIRRPPAGRQIVNLDEVEALTRDLGFETIDSADMTLHEQIELFRSTRCLLSVHGAGMTNMMFRAGGRMSVIELSPDVWHPDVFALMAEQLGFDFSRLTFPAAPHHNRQQAGFAVDPAQLATALEATLHAIAVDGDRSRR